MGIEELTHILSRGYDTEEVVTGSGLIIGDKAKILNPSHGQETACIVCGATNDLFIKIKPKMGKVIRRLPMNLHKL